VDAARAVTSPSESTLDNKTRKLTVSFKALGTDGQIIDQEITV